jgi:hypothetical protein
MTICVEVDLENGQVCVEVDLENGLPAALCKSISISGVVSGVVSKY